MKVAFSFWFLSPACAALTTVKQYTFLIFFSWDNTKILKNEYITVKNWKMWIMTSLFAFHINISIAVAKENM